MSPALAWPAVGDPAVLPPHGLGRIADRSVRESSVGRRECVVWVNDAGLQVVVPIVTAAIAGLRAPMTAEQATWVLSMLQYPAPPADPAERFLARMGLLRRGLPEDLAEVCRGLHAELCEAAGQPQGSETYALWRSYRTVLEQLVTELGLALRTGTDEVLAHVERLLADALTRRG